MPLGIVNSHSHGQFIGHVDMVTTLPPEDAYALADRTPATIYLKWAGATLFLVS
jgi:hypothetical protein